MDPFNPFFPLIIYLIAFCTAYLIRLKYKPELVPAHFETIDGLRGFLALGVFIHHTTIWFQYIQTNEWNEPPTKLLKHFGFTSVTFFFMITSFLFVTKLLNAKETGFNWRNFFISRLFRIAPMYYFSLAIILFFVMYHSHWKINVPSNEFFRSLINRLLFTVWDVHYINGQYALLINAGVQWSLLYEWVFYFNLPLIALFILKVKPKIFYFLIGAAVMAFFFYAFNVEVYHFYAFFGGAIAPFLLKYTSLADKIKKPLIAVVIILCLFVIIQFDTDKDIYCQLLITIVFTLIAMGNSIFGILKNANLKFLGEIGYSTYLLHGIILFTVFDFGFGIEKSKTFTALHYSLIIFCLTTLVVLISFLGFRFIEKPFMNLSKKINQKLNMRYPAL